VVIVKTRGDEQKYRRILVSFDGGVFSRVAVEFAARLAEVSEAELTLAISGAPGGDDRPAASDKLESDPPRAIEGGVGGSGIRFPTGDSDEDLARISPLLLSLPKRPTVIPLSSELMAGGLSREASSGKYDLVVIGAENRAVQHRLYFGAENERLLRSSPVTVALIVPSVGLLH
jgi:nucleotide-binding universal stress UspA family protein